MAFGESIGVDADGNIEPGLLDIVINETHLIRSSGHWDSKSGERDDAIDVDGLTIDPSLINPRSEVSSEHLHPIELSTGELPPALLLDLVNDFFVRFPTEKLEVKIGTSNPITIDSSKIKWISLRLLHNKVDTSIIFPSIYSDQLNNATGKFEAAGGEYGYLRRMLSGEVKADIPSALAFMENLNMFLSNDLEQFDRLMADDTVKNNFVFVMEYLDSVRLMEGSLRGFNEKLANKVWHFYNLEREKRLTGRNTLMKDIIDMEARKAFEKAYLKDQLDIIAKERIAERAEKEDWFANHENINFQSSDPTISILTKKEAQSSFSSLMTNIVDFFNTNFDENASIVFRYTDTEGNPTESNPFYDLDSATDYLHSLDPKVYNSLTVTQSIEPFIELEDITPLTIEEEIALLPEDRPVVLTASLDGMKRDLRLKRDLNFSTKAEAIVHIRTHPNVRFENPRALRVIKDEIASLPEDKPFILTAVLDSNNKTDLNFTTKAEALAHVKKHPNVKFENPRVVVSKEASKSHIEVREASTSTDLPVIKIEDRIAVLPEDRPVLITAVLGTEKRDLTFASREAALAHVNKYPRVTFENPRVAGSQQTPKSSPEALVSTVRANTAETLAHPMTRSSISAKPEKEGFFAKLGAITNNVKSRVAGLLGWKNRG